MSLTRLGTVTTRMALAAAVVGAAACYPDEITDVTEFDTVVTVPDTTTNFATALRYVLRDTIVHLPLEDNNYSHAGDDAVVARIRANMNAAGYQEVQDTTNADFLVATFLTTRQYVFIDWIGGCWYPYYGCWGWYYPSYPYVYTYETGTVMVLIMDRRRRDQGLLQMPIAWFAAVNGVVDVGGEVDRAVEGIDQAFAQSPYLSRN
jgi:hypothetical protein